MISNILTVLSFLVLLLSAVIDCNFLSRLTRGFEQYLSNNFPLNHYGWEGFVLYELVNIKLTIYCYTFVVILHLL